MFPIHITLYGGIDTVMQLLQAQTGYLLRNEKYNNAVRN
jgi:hypothetical protein